MTMTIHGRHPITLRLAAAAGFVIAAAGLAVVGQQAQTASQFVATLHLPGTAAPDASSLERLSITSFAAAVVSVAMVVALAMRGGRAAFIASVAWSVVVGMTALVAVGTTTGVAVFSIGQIAISPAVATGTVLVGALIAGTNASIGWLRASPEQIMRQPYMPPPTHLD